MWWDYPIGDDGTTLRQHFQSVKTQGGFETAEAPPPEPWVPWFGEEIWLWFWELRNGMGGNGFSANVISYQELKAWMDCTGIKPPSYAIRAIREMDVEYHQTVSELKRKYNKGG